MPGNLLFKEKNDLIIVQSSQIGVVGGHYNLQHVELKNKRTTSPKGEKDWVLVQFTAFNLNVSFKKIKWYIDISWFYIDYYVYFKLKR